MPEKPSFWSFARSFREHWFAAMSGGFSVPFVFASAWLDNIYGKLILLALAFSGAWFAAYTVWKHEREKLIQVELALFERDQKRQQLLDDISALRENVGSYRIEIENDRNAQRLDEKAWEHKFDVLQDEIACKIEQFASKAEAVAYRHRGNIQRPLNPMMGGFLNPLLVDICIHDLDYLRQFIHDYSRHKERPAIR